MTNKPFDIYKVVDEMLQILDQNDVPFQITYAVKAYLMNKLEPLCNYNRYSVTFERGLDLDSPWDPSTLPSSGENT